MVIPQHTSNSQPNGASAAIKQPQLFEAFEVQAPFTEGPVNTHRIIASCTIESNVVVGNGVGTGLGSGHGSGVGFGVGCGVGVPEFVPRIEHDWHLPDGSVQ